MDTFKKQRLIPPSFFVAFLVLISYFVGIPPVKLDFGFLIISPLLLVCLLIILPPLLILFLLLWLLPKFSTRAKCLKGLIPPLFFLYAAAWLFYLLFYVLYITSRGTTEQQSDIANDITRIEPGVIEVILGFTVAFVLPWLLPTTWILIERVWWRIFLRGSPTFPKLRNDTLTDFELSIRSREVDGKLPRQFAFMFALNARLVEFPKLHRDLIREKNQKEKQLFKATIDNLSEGWRSGLPPAILDKYIEFIDSTLNDIEDDREQLRARCAIADVKSLVGDIFKARELAKENRQDAQAKNDFILKCMASYAYFNATAYSGDFENGIILMADHWSECYRGEDRRLEEIIREVSDMMINPVLAIPRHLLLATAFNGAPICNPQTGEIQYWPNEEDNTLTLNERKKELKWVESWYEKAKEICANDLISLGLSHAYAGFYYTLLYLDSRDESIAKKAQCALDEINETSPMIARYVKAGFYGIFRLVTEENPEERELGALRLLRRAEQYSAVSGIRFGAIDCLFMGCRAIVAQRAQRGLEPEVDYCIREMRKLTKETENQLYSQLLQVVSSEISRMQGIPDNEPVDGPAAERILRIFKKEERQQEIIGISPKTLLKTAINNLNIGWRTGLASEILGKYMETIEETSLRIEDKELALRGRCAIANVKFLSGYWKEAFELAKKNWQDAGDDNYLQWMTSYTYFNTIAFLDDFKTGIKLMANHWNRYYISLSDDEQKKLIARLHYLTLNPILAMPRNLILAAAFKGAPEYEEQYWPAGEYDELKRNERDRELKWVESWYKQAKQVYYKTRELGMGADAKMSLDCSHAYAAFYYTLLYGDSQGGDVGSRESLRAKAKEALDAIVISEESRRTSLYVRSGFYGIFELVVEKDPLEALVHFREAARLSATSGNRLGVVDFLFECCHAVAAQRVEVKEHHGYLRPEVDEYLIEAEQEAKSIEHYFYLGLYAAARSEVSRIRGYEGRATRLDVRARNKMDQTGERILKIFRTEKDE